MLKKLSIFLLLFISLIGFANAGTTYLNSCGKSTNWLTNEVYVLNFTTVPAVYTGTYCYRAPGQQLRNVTFEGYGKKIIFEKDVGFFQTAINTNISESNFQNINIEILSSITPTADFFQGYSLSPYHNRFNNFNNISITNFRYFANRIQNSVWDGWIINNSYINTNSYFMVGGIGVGGYGVAKIYNSLIDSPNLYNSLPRTYIESSVVTSNANIYNSFNKFNKSIVRNFLHTDADNNNIADADIYTNIFSAVMSLSLANGKKYIQNFAEGQPFISNN